jgi:hypothetical protein
MRDIKSRHHVSGADVQATPLDTRVRQLPVSKHVMSTTNNNYYCTTATAIRNTGRRHANDAVDYTDVLREKLLGTQINRCPVEDNTDCGSPKRQRTAPLLLRWQQQRYESTVRQKGSPEAWQTYLERTSPARRTLNELSRFLASSVYPSTPTIDV